MKILVTGGAGFIGSHLVQRLLAVGYDVCIMDDLNDFYSPSLKRDNLAIISESGDVRFYEHDICDFERTKEIVCAERPDTIVHLAARAGVRPSLDDPLLYEKVNVAGTIALLEACRTAAVSRLVFASSSSIYGAANRVPFSEEDSVTLPISPYAATKIAAEKMCYTYSHLYGIDTVCLRFFTVYGPRQRPDLAIRKFAELIDRGEPIPVFGDPSKGGRDYTYIDDIVAGIITSIQLATRYDVFNLGNSRPIPLATVIGTLEQTIGKKAAILELPPQPGDVPITYADIAKAKRLLAYNPETPFELGIERFVQWQVNRRNSLSVTARG